MNKRHYNSKKAHIVDVVAEILGKGVLLTFGPRKRVPTHFDISTVGLKRRQGPISSGFICSMAQLIFRV